MTDATHPAPAVGNVEAAAVLAFWLEDALDLGWPSRDLGALWFGGGAALDRDIEQRFGDLVRQALAGGLMPWESDARQRLALVILLDQFPRNMFRGSGRAFDGDLRAQALVQDGLQRGWDRALPLAGAIFFYMPLMHAEDLALQERCVQCFSDLLATAPPDRQEGLQSNLKFAREHRDIVARFGRFPHRNAALGRTSSAAELAFLQGGPRYGQ